MSNMEYPDKKTAKISYEMNNCIGFVCSEADRQYDLVNGETALFWHIVAVIANHVRVKDDETSSEGPDT